MAKTADNQAVGKSADERIAALEASTNKVWATVRKVVKVLERMFGVDIDRDGKVGVVRVGVLVTFALVCAAGLVCAGVVWDVSSSSQGNLKAESSSGQITLTVDKLTVTNGATISALAAAGLTGNTPLAALTNALDTAGGVLITNTCLAEDGKTNTYIFGPVGSVYVLRSITTSP